MLLSVILPNYNGSALLRRNLPDNYAMLAQEIGDDFEIVVSDDHSRDNSLAYLHTLGWPNMHITLHPGARGFGSNCNHGAQAAKGTLLFFLNTDVRLTAGCLAPLLAKVKEDVVFSVVPRIVRERDGHIESLNTAHLTQDEIKVQRSTASPDQNHPVLYSCGAALLCKRERFFELGGFSPEFKRYYIEDTDLSVKAWRNGYENWYVGSSTVLHEHSFTTCNEWKWLKRFFAQRNGELFQLKHLPPAARSRRLRRQIWRHLRRLNLYRLAVLLIAYSAIPKGETYQHTISDVIVRLHAKIPPC